MPEINGPNRRTSDLCGPLPLGELVLHIFAAYVQMERRLISERSRASLAVGRAGWPSRQDVYIWSYLAVPSLTGVREERLGSFVHGQPR